MTTPPTGLAAGLCEMAGAFLAYGVKKVCEQPSTALQTAPRSTVPIDELSLVVSLALAVLYPRTASLKPREEEKAYITWDSDPLERQRKNRITGRTVASRETINYWEAIIYRALQMYLPGKMGQQESPVNLEGTPHLPIPESRPTFFSAVNNNPSPQFSFTPSSTLAYRPSMGTLLSTTSTTASTEARTSFSIDPLSCGLEASDSDLDLHRSNSRRMHEEITFIFDCALKGLINIKLTYDKEGVRSEETSKALESCIEKVANGMAGEIFLHRVNEQEMQRRKKVLDIWSDGHITYIAHQLRQGQQRQSQSDQQGNNIDCGRHYRKSVIHDMLIAADETYEKGLRHPFKDK